MVVDCTYVTWVLVHVTTLHRQTTKWTAARDNHSPFNVLARNLAALALVERHQHEMSRLYNSDDD